MRRLFRFKPQERSTSQPGVLASLFNSGDECFLLSNPVGAICDALLGARQEALQACFVHFSKVPLCDMQH